MISLVFLMLCSSISTPLINGFNSYEANQSYFDESLEEDKSDPSEENDIDSNDWSNDSGSTSNLTKVIP